MTFRNVLVNLILVICDRLTCSSKALTLVPLSLLLTTLPLGVAQFQVVAGACRVLLGAVGAAQVLDLIVQGLETGVHLNVVLPQRAGGLVGPHVPERIRGLLGLTQTGKG